eukprot:1192213-Prorocentrum_minimum.AAC.1
MAERAHHIALADEACARVATVQHGAKLIRAHTGCTLVGHWWASSAPLTRTCSLVRLRSTVYNLSW